METRRCARSAVVLGSIAILVLGVVGVSAPDRAAAQSALPDVDLQIVLDVPNSAAWLSLYSEALGTRPDSPKPLVLSVAAGTGGQRSITVFAPKFQVTIQQGARTYKVVVAGKISGTEALGNLPAFEAAVLDMQAGSVPNEIVLLYGLSSVIGGLTELDLTR